MDFKFIYDGYRIMAIKLISKSCNISEKMYNTVTEMQREIKII